jgi:GGDEF domain-containing protein
MERFLEWLPILSITFFTNSRDIFTSAISMVVKRVASGIFLTDSLKALWWEFQIAPPIEICTTTRSEGISIAASFGMAYSDGGIKVGSLRKAADSGLYRAKESGHNQICHASLKEFSMILKIDRHPQMN